MKDDKIKKILIRKLSELKSLKVEQGDQVQLQLVRSYLRNISDVSQYKDDTTSELTRLKKESLVNSAYISVDIEVYEEFSSSLDHKEIFIKAGMLENIEIMRVLFAENAQISFVDDVLQSQILVFPNLKELHLRPDPLAGSGSGHYILLKTGEKMTLLLEKLYFILASNKVGAQQLKKLKVIDLGFTCLALCVEQFLYTAFHTQNQNITGIAYLKKISLINQIQEITLPYSGGQIKKEEEDEITQNLEQNIDIEMLASIYDELSTFNSKESDEYKKLEKKFNVGVNSLLSKGVLDANYYLAKFKESSDRLEAYNLLKLIPESSYYYKNANYMRANLLFTSEREKLEDINEEEKFEEIIRLLIISGKNIDNGCFLANVVHIYIYNGQGLADESSISLANILFDDDRQGALSRVLGILRVQKQTVAANKRLELIGLEASTRNSIRLNMLEEREGIMISFHQYKDTLYQKELTKQAELMEATQKGASLRCNNT